MSGIAQFQCEDAMSTSVSSVNVSSYFSMRDGALPTLPHSSIGLDHRDYQTLVIAAVQASKYSQLEPVTNDGCGTRQHPDRVLLSIV